MKYTGRPNLIEDEYDIDHKITEVVNLTQIFIENLINEVGIADYKKIAGVIINEHMETLINL